MARQLYEVKNYMKMSCIVLALYFCKIALPLGNQDGQNPRTEQNKTDLRHYYLL